MRAVDGFDFDDGKPSKVMQFTWDEIHLDHIVAKSLRDDPVVEQGLANMIGNLTPLAGGKNRKLGNMPYGPEKAKIYRGAKVPMTIEIGEDRVKWTPSDVQRRTKELADKAAKVWSLSPEIWD